MDFKVFFPGDFYISNELYLQRMIRCVTSDDGTCATSDSYPMWYKSNKK